MKQQTQIHYIYQHNQKLNKLAYARFYHGLLNEERGALPPLESPDFSDPALCVTSNYNGNEESFLSWNQHWRETDEEYAKGMNKKKFGYDISEIQPAVRNFVKHRNHVVKTEIYSAENQANYQIGEMRKTIIGNAAAPYRNAAVVFCYAMW